MLPACRKPAAHATLTLSPPPPTGSTDSANFESYESAVGGQPGAQVAGNVPVGDAGSKYR